MPSTFGWAQETREEWRQIAMALLGTPLTEPEPKSVLAQLNEKDALPPGLLPAAAFVSVQAGRFLLSALDIPLEPDGLGVLAPAGPLARSALLCASKLVSVCAPLCLETRHLGPAAQLTHDVHVEGFLEQERRNAMTPGHPSVTAWLESGRQWQLERINSLRSALGESSLNVDGVRPHHVLVREGMWIWDAQRKSASLRELQGAELDEFDARMEWAWFRGSTITHGAPSFRAEPGGMSYVYLDGEEASALLRCAAEMAVSASMVANGAVRSGAAPASFAWNLGGRLPNRRPG